MDKTKHTHFNYLNRDTLSRQRKDTYQLSDTSNKNVLTLSTGIKSIDPIWTKY